MTQFSRGRAQSIHAPAMRRLKSSSQTPSGARISLHSVLAPPPGRPLRDTRFPPTRGTAPLARMAKVFLNARAAKGGPAPKGKEKRKARLSKNMRDSPGRSRSAAVVSAKNREFDCRGSDWAAGIGAVGTVPCNFTNGARQFSRPTPPSRVWLRCGARPRKPQIDRWFRAARGARSSTPMEPGVSVQSAERAGAWDAARHSQNGDFSIPYNGHLSIPICLFSSKKVKIVTCSSAAATCDTTTVPDVGTTGDAGRLRLPRSPVPRHLSPAIWPYTMPLAQRPPA